IMESDGSTQTSESGTTDSFQVSLTSQPISNVVINLASENTDEGTVSPTSLTFTPLNYSISQTVTVTGVDDAAVDGPQTFDITLNVQSGSDPAYEGLSELVSVENLDDDEAGFLIVESDGSTQTSESGTTDSFQVSLTTQPTSAVMVTVESENVEEGTVSPISLNFNPGNYNNPQTVTVTGVDDILVDGTQTYVVRLIVESTTDANYINLSEREITVTNEDDDVYSATITTDANPASEEGLIAGSFLVNLNPTNNTGSPITISYTVDDEDDNAATPGVDYVALSGSVDIPDGDDSASIIVTPINDTTVELTETITVNLANGPGYTVGIPATATVDLESEDNDSPGG